MVAKPKVSLALEKVSLVGENFPEYIYNDGEISQEIWHILIV